MFHLMKSKQRLPCLVIALQWSHRVKCVFHSCSHELMKCLHHLPGRWLDHFTNPPAIKISTPTVSTFDQYNIAKLDFAGNDYLLPVTSCLDAWHKSGYSDKRDKKRFSLGEEGRIHPRVWPSFKMPNISTRAGRVWRGSLEAAAGEAGALWRQHDLGCQLL